MPCVSLLTAADALAAQRVAQLREFQADDAAGAGQDRQGTRRRWGFRMAALPLVQITCGPRTCAMLAIAAAPIRRVPEEASRRAQTLPGRTTSSSRSGSALAWSTAATAARSWSSLPSPEDLCAVLYCQVGR